MTGSTTSLPVLSVIIPMFNEETVLPVLFERLTRVLDDIGESYEILCVDDGSSDATGSMLAEAHAKDPRIRVLTLSRNFGKEIALTAGLDHANGQAVLPLDADLQDPPELISQFLAHWREGYDVVYGVRRERTSDSWLKRITANLFYKTLGRMAGLEIPANAGDFRLMDRRVVDSLDRLRERNRFMKGLFAWIGFRQIAVEYDRPARAAGKTKYNYWRLWNLALDGITGFSTVPLRSAGYVGFLTAIFAIFYGIFLIIRTLIYGVDVPGYASLMAVVLLLGGVQLMVLGIIGEYLGRVFKETKHRPLYILDSTLGISKDQSGQGARASEQT